MSDLSIPVWERTRAEENLPRFWPPVWRPWRAEGGRRRRCRDGRQREEVSYKWRANFGASGLICYRRLTCILRLLLLTVTYSNVLLCTLYSLAWRHMWVGDFLRCVTNLSKTQTRLQSSYHDSSFCALGSAFMSISFSATFLMLSNFAAMWSGVSPDSGVETLTWAPWSQRNNAENSSSERN